LLFLIYLFVGCQSVSMILMLYCTDSTFLMQQKDRGGRLVVLTSAIPNHGPGALKPREEVGILGTDKERALYVPQDQLFKKLATDSATSGVCVDLIFTGAGYQDVATVGVLPSMTGGDAYHFPSFNQGRDSYRLEACLLNLCSRNFGFDALLRVRCGNGLRLVDHYGNFYMKGTTDLELAGIDSEKALAIHVKHDGKLENNVEAGFQCALLYTTAFGQRRIRVHNLAIQTCTTLDQVFRFAEMDTTLNFMAKHGETSIQS
jgi:protein transport protein SEC24